MNFKILENQITYLNDAQKVIYISGNILNEYSYKQTYLDELKKRGIISNGIHNNIITFKSDHPKSSPLYYNTHKKDKKEI